MTKEGIAKFSSEDWNYIGLPIGVKNILKEWASPQGKNSSLFFQYSEPFL